MGDLLREAHEELQQSRQNLATVQVQIADAATRHIEQLEVYARVLGHARSELNAIGKGLVAYSNQLQAQARLLELEADRIGEAIAILKEQITCTKHQKRGDSL